MNPIIKPPWTREDLARWGLRSIDDFTVAPMEGEDMMSVVVVVAIIAGAGWIVWGRRSRWGTPTGPLPSAGIPSETLAFEAFTHGNTCLAKGKFADATAAFKRARELDPKRLHCCCYSRVADRLAEVARGQYAPPATAPAGTPS